MTQRSRVFILETASTFDNSDGSELEPGYALSIDKGEFETTVSIAFQSVWSITRSERYRTPAVAGAAAGVLPVPSVCRTFGR